MDGMSLQFVGQAVPHWLTVPCLDTTDWSNLATSSPHRQHYDIHERSCCTNLLGVVFGIHGDSTAVVVYI
jgi:hypothetical protein